MFTLSRLYILSIYIQSFVIVKYEKQELDFGGLYILNYLNDCEVIIM